MISTGGIPHPPLTTIHQPKDELGKLAVDKLLRRMDDADAPSDLLVLTPH